MGEYRVSAQSRGLFATAKRLTLVSECRRGGQNVDRKFRQ